MHRAEVLQEGSRGIGAEDRPTRSQMLRGNGVAPSFVTLRPEWLIGTGRLVTCICAVVALYIDPTKPKALFSETALVLAAYSGIAVFLVVWPPRQRLDHRSHFVTHGIDIIALGLLAFLSDELTSPFFAFFPFALLTATMRWGWRGAMFTALALEVVLVAVGWPDLEDGESELNVLIMRATYFLVAAVMLGYFGAYRARTQQRLTALAAWPLEEVSDGGGPWLRTALCHAADVLGADCVVVVWRDHERSAGNLACWNSLTGAFERHADVDGGFFTSTSRCEPIFIEAVDLRNLIALEPVLSLLSLHRLMDASDTRSFSTAACSSVRYESRIIVVAPQPSSEDIVAMTEIVAVRIASELERFALLQEIACSARSNERVRLARDLHDSVLQDLAAANLQLKSITDRMPNELRGQLASVSGIVLDQQQRIRGFIEDVDPSADQSRQLHTLGRFAHALGQRWSCKLNLTVDPPDLEVRDEVIREIQQILSEATANAVRHGGAKHIDIEFFKANAALRLRICDDGRGMPQDTQGLAPASLAERTESLGGTLRACNASPGFVLLIDLPLRSSVSPP